MEAGTYLSRFTLRTVEDGRTTELTRRLYWRRAAGGALEIVSEDSG
ncbi:MAG: hypothetical protein HKN64_02465 [Woeseiaceae bacterium]|nr:hypothetical protein [Woeseiaceae bacterium]